MDLAESSAVLAGGVVMLLLRLGNILVEWVSNKMGVEEKPALFNDPSIQKKGPDNAGFNS